MRKAFTLAEVLITLGIAGVITALTLPPLIQNYKKEKVENSLKKFYSVMNQAVTLSISEYGEIEDPSKYSETLSAEWFKKYITKHINTIKSEKIHSNTYYEAIFIDGSSFTGTILNNEQKTVSIRFCVNHNKCEHKDIYSGDGINSFRFTYSNNQIVPAYYQEKRTDVLIQTCTNSVKDYCLVLIYLNSWKIPDNYPLKF